MKESAKSSYSSPIFSEENIVKGENIDEQTTEGTSYDNKYQTTEGPIFSVILDDEEIKLDDEEIKLEGEEIKQEKVKLDHQKEDLVLSIGDKLIIKVKDNSHLCFFGSGNKFIGSFDIEEDDFRAVRLYDSVYLTILMNEKIRLFKVDSALQLRYIGLVDSHIASVCKGEFKAGQGIKFHPKEDLVAVATKKTVYVYTATSFALFDKAEFEGTIRDLTLWGNTIWVTTKEKKVWCQELVTGTKKMSSKDEIEDMFLFENYLFNIVSEDVIDLKKKPIVNFVMSPDEFNDLVQKWLNKGICSPQYFAKEDYNLKPYYP